MTALARATHFLAEVERAYPIYTQASAVCALLVSLVECEMATQRSGHVVLPNPHNFFFAIDHLANNYTRYISIKELEDDADTLLEVQSWLYLFNACRKRYHAREYEGEVRDNWAPGWGADALCVEHAVAAMDHCVGLMLAHLLATDPRMQSLAVPVK
jgi:hypothetical protein